MKRLKKQKIDSNYNEDHKNKRAVVLTGRVHSGETVSSFMIKGALDFLLSDSKQAKLLRKNFVFRIIPMLNPDGVRYGNFRCSLLGVDLNRRWDNPSKILHPTIYYAKKMIQVLNESHKIVLFCDMHGHTRKKNVFMYGCSYKTNDYLDYRYNLLAKVFPVLMASRNKFFSYPDSHFRIEPDTLSTARIVLSKLLEIPHSYTMEASFFGPADPKAFGNEYKGDMHMNEQNLASLGETLCRLCLNFTSELVFYKTVRYVNDFLTLKITTQKTTENIVIPEIIEEENFENKETINDLWENIEVVKEDISDQDSGGSDSCPSERDQSLKRSKSSIKTIKTNDKISIKKSPSILKIVQNRDLSTERAKKRIVLNDKLVIAPKHIPNKLKISIPVISPKLPRNFDSSKLNIPPLCKFVRSSHKVEPRQLSMKNISKLNGMPMLPNEAHSYNDVRVSKPVLTPRNYKLTNLSWLGPNAQVTAKNLANNTRFLANKLYNKIMDNF